MDLSILIPARNEMFLARTIENILDAIEADTEVIAVLDGKWADPPVARHDRVTVVFLPEPIGQRAAINLACRLSRAKYVMKVDAHCSFDKGFDRKLIADMHDDWTVAPLMKNLHAFDWVCRKCGNRWYQGPTPTHCCTDAKGKIKNPDCDSTEFFRDIKWIGKPRPQSFSFRFDETLHFQYWGAYKKQQSGELVESMSLQGSAFMMTRKKYWELNICDEDFGSWGQQGVEVALKTWLSGGRVIINKRTWYAHMFRTQGGDFSFPYPITRAQVDHARRRSRDLFVLNKWPGASRTFQSVIDQFDAPWPTKSIIYYTDNRLNIRLAKTCRKQLIRSGLPIISASLKPMNFGKQNIVLPGPRGFLTMFRQILAALEASTADIIFFAEHDVLYHPAHFDFVPPDKNTFYYNNNVCKYHIKTRDCVTYDCRWTSQLCAWRELLVAHYRRRIALIEAGNHRLRFEPGTRRGIDDHPTENWESRETNVDLRHGNNLTGCRRFRPEDFRVAPKNFQRVPLPGWAEKHLKK